MRDATDSPTVRQSSIDDLTQLRVYVAVFETASFSSAARRLSMTPSTVSRHISDLEAKLGALLVSRTTRQLVITDAGRRFYRHCVNILDEIGLAENELEAYVREPKGLVRVTAPAVLAQRHIAPHLPQLLARYPGLAVDMILTSQTLDLVGEGIDLAIRVTGQPDEAFVAIKLAPNRRLFVASPAYLDRHGTPLAPAELAKHNCLLSRQDGAGAPWPMRIDGEARPIRLSGNLFADNGEILLEAALQGVGIAMMPAFLSAPYVRAGRLVSILKDYAVDTTAIYALLPNRKYVPRRVRCFIDFMKALLATPPWEA